MTTASSDNVHVIWNDLTPGNFEIYYKKSLNGGTTWSGIARLTWNSGSSYSPDIAIDDNSDIHIVWHDDTPGDYEIYYRKFIK